MFFAQGFPENVHDLQQGSSSESDIAHLLVKKRQGLFKGLG